MIDVNVTIKLEKSQSNNNVIWLNYIFVDLGHNKKVSRIDYYPRYIRFTKINNVYISEDCVIDKSLANYLHDNDIATIINISRHNWYRFKLTSAGLVKLL